MNELFMVKFGSEQYIFDKKEFLKFVKKAKHRNWSFYIGELNSNRPLISSRKLNEEEFLKIFNPNEITCLLKYKETKFGSNTISEKPFFTNYIYAKYGQKIAWKDKY